MSDPSPGPVVDLDAIAHALTADVAVRARLVRDYGLADDLSDKQLIDALLRKFDQAPADDPYEDMGKPRTVFRAAVRSLGSNSRPWITFVRREPELADLLHGYDPRATHESALRGDLSEQTLIEYFPGITRGQDARAVLRWAERLNERDFGAETRAVAGALDRLHDERLGGTLPRAQAMPMIVLLLANPRARWPGWDLLPDEVAALAARGLELPGMGATLGSELFRNLRWSGFKPDRHVMRLLDRWTPEVVETQEPAARELAAVAGRRDAPAIEFLQYSLAGQAVTPPGTAFSVADNLIWALGAYVEKKGRESGRAYVRHAG